TARRAQRAFEEHDEVLDALAVTDETLVGSVANLVGGLRQRGDRVHPALRERRVAAQHEHAIDEAQRPGIAPVDDLRQTGLPLYAEHQQAAREQTARAR